MPNQDLTPFLDARQNQLQLESGAGDAIDAKALGVLASDLALLIFTSQSGLPLKDMPVIALLTAFGLALLLSVIAVWPRKYAGASTNMFEHPEYLGFSTSYLVKQLIADTEAAIMKNKKINKRRWKTCAIALVITVIASLTLFIMLCFK